MKAAVARSAPTEATSPAITRHTPVSDLPELLRASEAAIVLDCSPGLINSMVHSGQLHGVWLGRLLRIPRSALEEMVGAK